jgi:hypothetical protein
MTEQEAEIVSRFARTWFQLTTRNRKQKVLPNLRFLDKTLSHQITILNLLSHPTTYGITDRDAYRVLEYMDLAMTLVPNEESAVDDFTMYLLLALGYAESVHLPAESGGIMLRQMSASLIKPD